MEKNFFDERLLEMPLYQICYSHDHSRAVLLAVTAVYRESKTPHPPHLRRVA